MDAGGSYGPDKQIDAANWITFFKRPQVILRIIAWVCVLFLDWVFINFFLHLITRLGNVFYRFWHY